MVSVCHVISQETQSMGHVTLHPHKFVDHMHYDSGDIIVLFCHAMLKYQVIKV